MRRTAAAAILLGMMTIPVKATEPPDGNRYPGWHNRLTGYQAVREPRWAAKRQKVVRHKAKPKRALASHRKRPPPGSTPIVAQTGDTRRLLSNGVGAFTAPARFIRGRLICAVNVGVALAARGIRGTGSALAKSYLTWGRPSQPVPGAVAVFNRGRRGGHVAIVHRVLPNGTVIYLNPSARRQAWVVGPYRKRPIAYRVAS